ncbi:peptidoglycan recognition protein family protein [Enterococcus sp. AZ103]|uniref:peptidoglycan recognition protein family protein n=1 Tax=Enterococcus sp. AZ103 TaxID=2774628 RepID=UPI003F280043
MTVSKLATPYMFQSFGAQRWWWGRSQPITTIVVHHAATTNFDAMPGVWATREASAHYGIGQTGQIRAYIDEDNTAWHCGNGNPYSIGIECTNTSGDPNWGVSDATVDALVSLIQEIQSRRGKLQIVGHRNVPGNSTMCPGPSLYPRLQEIRDQVNSSVVLEKEEPKKQEDEDMTEFVVVYNGAMYHVILGLKMRVFENEAQWNSFAGLYEQIHGKRIKDINMTGNDATFIATAQNCDMNAEKDFHNAVTEGIDEIKKALGYK